MCLRAPKISSLCVLRVRIWDEYRLDSEDRTKKNRYICAQEFSWVVGCYLFDMRVYPAHAVCLVACQGFGRKRGWD